MVRFDLGSTFEIQDFGLVQKKSVKIEPVYNGTLPVTKK